MTDRGQLYLFAVFRKYEALVLFDLTIRGGESIIFVAFERTAKVHIRV